MKIRHAPGNILRGYGTLEGTPQGPTLGYHDPVYDEGGGQGVPTIYSLNGDQQPNPGALLLIVGIIALVLLLGDDNG